MTDWYKAQAMEKPEEYDLTSSPATVYQRKGIKKVELPNVEGQEETLEVYEYQERTMLRDEYQQLQAGIESPAMKIIMQQLSAIELRQEMLTEMMEV